jgi:hypothetical protein
MRRSAASRTEKTTPFTSRINRPGWEAAAMTAALPRSDKGDLYTLDFEGFGSTGTSDSESDS